MLLSTVSAVDRMYVTRHHASDQQMIGSMLRAGPSDLRNHGLRLLLLRRVEPVRTREPFLKLFVIYHFPVSSLKCDTRPSSQ